ncbi:MAG: hypothetical protein HUU23_15730 [Caldilineales bacterium]|nr:hypothetical protein [Caldilineales bacterium]
MATVQIPLQIHSSRQRSRLIALYEQGQTSAVVERTLDKLISYEIEQNRAQLADLQHDLHIFEREYGFTSAEFYRRYQAGETDDRMDFVEWASLVQMARNLQAQIDYLIGEAGE